MNRIISVFLLFPIAIGIPLHCWCQHTGSDKEHAPGGQLGYSWMNGGKLDLGVNYYWSRSKGKSYKNGLHVHTLGPFASCDLNFLNGTTYVGQRLGFNYHYFTVWSIHFIGAIEHLAKQDFRAGAETGVSLAGLMLYYGYYVPVAEEVFPDIYRSRFGIRLVFNTAPISVTPF